MSRRNKGKHSATQNTIKINFKIILIIILLLLLVACGVKYFLDKDDTIIDNDVEVLENEDIENDEPSSEEIVDEEIPDKIGNYKVLGKIVIESIGVEQNILEETTEDALNLAVTKFYGPDINEPGNFVITGHNYKDIFAYLLKLKNGDTFYIIDKQNSRKVTYKIYNTYTVNPKELDCLEQNTDGKREVTLITCEPGAVTRFIIKAKEI